MKRVDIWAEGFNIQGNAGKATKLATVELSSLASFRDACKLSLSHLPHYERRTNTFWGCKLFDNEADARKSFG